MSLYPFWCEPDYHRPSRVLDQHFGLGLTPEELLAASIPRNLLPHSALRSRDYYRPWNTLARVASARDSGSTITADKDKFQVCLDVQQFAPSEISVKTVGNQIVVEGKHEEKQDEHGFISRHFVRKYQLPKDHNSEDVVSSLSTDGVLTITAPKKTLEAVEGERVVPIQSTGPAHQSIQGGASAKKQDDQKMQE